MKMILLSTLCCLLFLSGCDDESSPATPANQIVIQAVKITVMPFVDRNGIPWDSDGGPDVYLQVLNHSSSVAFDNREHAVTNVTSGQIPVSFPVMMRFDKSTDSCYVAVWDRDEPPADPDDLMGSTNTWLSAARLSALGNPETYEMSDDGMLLKLELTLLYR